VAATAGETNASTAVAAAAAAATAASTTEQLQDKKEEAEDEDMDVGDGTIVEDDGEGGKEGGDMSNNNAGPAVSGVSGGRDGGGCTAGKYNNIRVAKSAEDIDEDSEEAMLVKMP